MSADLVKAEAQRLANQATNTPEDENHASSENTVTVDLDAISQALERAEIQRISQGE